MDPGRDSDKCNTLQHAATRCNTLQHTATHCNTLRYTSTKHGSRKWQRDRYDRHLRSKEEGSLKEPYVHEKLLTKETCVNRALHKSKATWIQEETTRNLKSCDSWSLVVCCSVLQCVVVCCSVLQCMHGSRKRQRQVLWWLVFWLFFLVPVFRTFSWMVCWWSVRMCVFASVLQCVLQHTLLHTVDSVYGCVYMQVCCSMCCNTRFNAL